MSQSAISVTMGKTMLFEGFGLEKLHSLDTYIIF